MRKEPVCAYISQQLNTVVSVYSDEARLRDSWCYRPDFTDPFLADADISAFLFFPDEADFPSLYVINSTVAYIRFAGEKDLYLIGPVKLAATGSQPHARYYMECAFSDEQNSVVLMECTASHFLRTSLLLYNVLQPEDLDIFECFRLNFSSSRTNDQIQRSTSATIFENRENQKVHNPYGQEMRLMEAIETGNIKQLKDSWQETYPGVLGTTSKDPVRNGKNIAQYVISASARAAIRGGLQPELAFTLTDSYSLQVDELTDMSILESLVTDVELQLTQMVNDLKDRKKKQTSEPIPVIESCKQYIFAHLHSRLTVQEIADELKIHPSYLSTLFKKQEGVSIYKYILNQKIDLVKNLLTYSDYSFLEIANYLGFVSQSHLGKQFKTATGMTLKEYRDKYHKEEFSL